MKRITRPTHIICPVFSLLLCVAGMTATAGDPPGDMPTAPTLFYACMSSGKFIEYDSAAFAGKNPGAVYKDHYNLNLKMTAAFDAYLTQKYGFHGLVQCGRYNTLAEAQQWLQGRKSHVQGLGTQYQYVATDWTYDAGPSASEPAAAAPANAAASAGVPPAPASGVPTTFFVCTSSTTDAEYDSAVFESENSTSNGRMMRFAYQAYVTEKHNFHGSTSCMTRPTRAEAEKYLAENTPAARGLAARRISTGWVYVPNATAAAPPATPTTPVATVAPAPKPALPPAPAPKPVVPQPAAAPAATQPAAPAAAAAPKGVFVVCYADRDPNTLYYNPPVEGGDGNYETWMPSYKNFMKEKYRYRQNIRCNQQPTLDQAQAYYQTMLDQARGRMTMNGTPAPVVITNWEYP